MTPKIVAFVNADYIPVARNWMLALKAIGRDKDAVVVSLDEETRAAFLPAQVLHRPLALDSSNLAPLWVHRIGVLRELLSSGVAVIHSDVDALWLRDPLPDIERCETPVVFSQGTIWPPDVHAIHRVVLCCGFFYLAAQPEVVAFLDAAEDQIQADKDDQVAVNRVVVNMIDSWRISNPYRIMFRNTYFLASSSTIRSITESGQRDTLPISVLPHHAYPRLLDKLTKDMVVVHPLSGKTCAEKRDCFKLLGLWNAASDL